jgi:hypothetical protein
LPNGTFVGLEPIADFDPSDPRAHWFHKCTLTIKGTNATLSKIPVFIKEGAMSYSASDGGFLEYRGAAAFEGDHSTLYLALTASDYVQGAMATRMINVVYNENGSLQVGGQLYKRATSEKAP